jgi:hypothetical protein
MRGGLRTAVAIALAAFMPYGEFSAYEDESHQELSERALIVAAIHAPELPQAFASPDGDIGTLGLQIIAGAGRHEGVGMLGLPTDGEDYTIYRIEGDCDVKVRKWGSPAGVL